MGGPDRWRQARVVRVLTGPAGPLDPTPGADEGGTGAMGPGTALGGTAQSLRITVTTLPKMATSAGSNSIGDSAGLAGSSTTFEPLRV